MSDSLQFASTFDAMLAAKTYPKSVKNRSEMMSKIQCVMWSILWSILGGLGGSLGRPNLSYLGCRSGPVLDTLSYLILSYLILPYLGYLGYLCYLGLSWVTRGRSSSEVWGQQVSLGNTPPRAPQEPPKSLARGSQEPPRALQEGLGDRFVVYFW